MGPHIVKTEPSAEVVETLATAIGARSQSARTYLERHLQDFPQGFVFSILRLILTSNKLKLIIKSTMFGHEIQCG